MSTLMFKPTPLNPELAALLEAVKSHEMTPAEQRAQRVSFVYGMLPNGDTRSKEDVARWLAKHDGYADIEAENSRLTARIAELEKALKPFAKISGVAVARRPPPPHQDRLWSYYDSRNDIQYEITRAHVDNARTTLEASERGGRE